MQIANSHLNSLFSASAKFATRDVPAASWFGCVCVREHESVRRQALTLVTDMGHPLTATEGVDTPLKATDAQKESSAKVQSAI